MPCGDQEDDEHNDQEVFIGLQNQRNNDSVSFNVNDVIGTCIFHDQY